ncbi:maleylpyruvate isomerase family mycothiol-dependent enzyme [Dactylosporangium sp. NBC_01737]|uniref:maleylpyruvate isomerase family mycothiol-dependent enzyme n=1 Tax=Dactylosporangium sp. NBC_01737 TaxID=2975959 RepID=UPI002E13030F|nr:maleylpyruvate isomerase family mycothiol-dependent enzyme [Dactylosporangium sp. NBC_01737]
MSQDDAARAAVTAERTELAEVFAGLRPQQWDQPSLCAGWRVREVLAHTTMPFRMGAGGFVWEMLRSGGRFGRMADRVARRDAARMPAEALVRCLRDNVAHPWSPPGGGPVGALSHEVIHGLDSTVALGLDRRVPTDRLLLVLDAMRPRTVGYFGADLAGVQLCATDLDWTWGTGDPLRGLAQDLLLVVCGRRLPAGHLEGGPSARFTAG